MTTAYVVEVQLPDGAKYLSINGKLSPVPKFFLSRPTVRKYILQGAHHSNNYYNPKKHSEDTRIIVITQLEKGLKDSKAEILFYGQFVNSMPAMPSARPKTHKNAIYKLRLANGQWVSPGKLKPKFGKIWNRAGDLRAHLTRTIRNCKLTHLYANAEVIEITMEDDGVCQKMVNIFPVEMFYRESPALAARLAPL